MIMVDTLYALLRAGANITVESDMLLMPDVLSHAASVAKMSGAVLTIDTRNRLLMPQVLAQIAAAGGNSVTFIV